MRAEPLTTLLRERDERPRVIANVAAIAAGVPVRTLQNWASKGWAWVEPDPGRSAPGSFRGYTFFDCKRLALQGELAVNVGLPPLQARELLAQAFAGHWLGQFPSRSISEKEMRDLAGKSLVIDWDEVRVPTAKLIKNSPSRFPGRRLCVVLPVGPVIYAALKRLRANVRTDENVLG
jgi:hypothetical protein